MPMWKRLKKPFYFLWMLIGLIGFILNSMSVKFSNSVVLNPQTPNSDQGLIFPFVTKGRVVYINLEEQQFISVLNRMEVSIAVLLLLMFFVLTWLWKSQK
jgi:hypothetical protein